GHFQTFETEVLLHFLPHALLDGLQILGCEGSIQIDVIEKTVFNYWAYAELGFWEHFQNACGHDMCQRVTFGIEGFVFRHSRIPWVSILCLRGQDHGTDSKSHCSCFAS